MVIDEVKPKVKKVKAKKIPAPTKEEVNARVDGILKALVSQNGFEFNMLMLQLSNWSVAKRKQVFRAILQNLISKTGSFEWQYLNPVLKATGSNYYSSHTINLRAKTLDTFVDKVKEMDASQRFSPEKVYTISHLNMKLISSTPATLKYLLDKNILVLGSSFKFKSTKETGIRGNVRTFHYASRNIAKLKIVYDNFELNPDIMYCPKRYHLVQVANIYQNLNIISDQLISDPKNLSQYQISVLVQINTLFGQLIKDLEEHVSTMLYGGLKSWKLLQEELDKVPERNTMSEEEYIAIKSNMRLDLLKEIQTQTNLISAQKQFAVSDIAPEDLFDPYNAVV